MYAQDHPPANPWVYRYSASWAVLCPPWYTKNNSRPGLKRRVLNGKPSKTDFLFETPICLINNRCVYAVFVLKWFVTFCWCNNQLQSFLKTPLAYFFRSLRRRFEQENPYTILWKCPCTLIKLLLYSFLKQVSHAGGNVCLAIQHQQSGTLAIISLKILPHLPLWLSLHS